MGKSRHPAQVGMTVENMNPPVAAATIRARRDL